MNMPNKNPFVTAVRRNPFCAILLTVVTLGCQLEADESPSVTLTNVTVREGQSAKFVSAVTGRPPFSYQWSLNREPISGATAETYTVEKPLMENHIDLYSVVVSNQFGTATAGAVLSVIADPPPSIDSVLNLGLGNQLVVLFSAPVNPESAYEAGNYSVDETPALKARRLDDRTVILETNPLEPGRHSLTAKNVKNLSGSISADDVSAEIELGLKFWFQFEEADEDLVDSSGNGISAALKDKSMHTENGRVGAGLHFNGTTDYATMPPGMEDFTNGITVAVWAKPASVKRYARFLEFASGTPTDNIIFGRLADTDGLLFEVYTDVTSGGKVVAPSAINLGTWQHFAATMDSKGKVRLYKNGAFLAEGKTALPENIKRKNNYIGRSNWAPDIDQFYEGDLDELRFYDRPLSAREIKILAEGANAPGQ